MKASWANLNLNIKSATQIFQITNKHFLRRLVVTQISGKACSRNNQLMQEYKYASLKS